MYVLRGSMSHRPGYLFCDELASWRRQTRKKCMRLCKQYWTDHPHPNFPLNTFLPAFFGQSVNIMMHKSIFMWWLAAYAGVVVVVVVRTKWYSRMSWERFDLESPNVMWTFTPVDNNTGHDVTIYFRSEVIDVRKTAENDASDGFGSNSSLAAFCLPTNWWASCLWCTKSI